MIEESHSISGTIRDDIASKYGLSPETVVTVGTQDAYASILADNVTSYGDSSFVYATSGVFDILHDGKKFSNLFANTRHVLPGVYVAEAAMYNAGSLLNWFGGITGKKLRFLDKEASRKERPGKIITIPFLSGERAPIWNNRIRGAFNNISLDSDRADLYLSLLEGTGYWLNYVLKKAEEININVKRIVAGGGGSKSNIWTQIVSDIVGKDQEINYSDGAAEGDIYISEKSEGWIKDYSELRDLVKIKKVVKSKHSMNNKYLIKYRDFLELLNFNLHRINEGSI